MSASARAPRVALYSRVSSEEQAERETIQAQQIDCGISSITRSIGVSTIIRAAMG